MILRKMFAIARLHTTNNRSRAWVSMPPIPLELAIHQWNCTKCGLIIVVYGDHAVRGEFGRLAGDASLIILIEG